MNEISPSANKLWQSYLEEVRLLLSDLETGDTEEVIDSLEAHMETEISDQARTLSGEDMQALIERLGSAEKIAEAYGIELGEKEVISSQDIFLLFLGLIVLAAGLAMPLLLLVAVPLSGLLGRIVLGRPGVILSSYRYAAYPGLFLTYFVATLLLTFWPLLLVLPTVANGGFIYELLTDQGGNLEPGSAVYWARAWSTAILLSGCWVLLLSRFTNLLTRNLHLVFFPFLNRGQYRLSRVLVFSGVALIASASLVLVFI